MTNALETSAKPKKRGGRGNLLPINPESVRILAATQAPVRRIAAVLGCNEKTLRNRFREVIELGREAGLSKLQQRQWQAAMDGNVTMMIWLGKQHLGQSDRAEIKQESYQLVIMKDDEAATSKDSDNGKPEAG